MEITIRYATETDWLQLGCNENGKKGGILQPFFIADYYIRFSSILFHDVLFYLLLMIKQWEQKMEKHAYTTSLLIVNIVTVWLL